jgi:hypothetical protein
LCAPDFNGETDRTGQPRISARREAEGLQRGRKLQRLTFRYKHGRRQECICICHDDVGYRLQLRMAGPLMNAENQDKWMILRPTSSAQWCVSLALLSATTSPSPSFSQGTLEQRLACTPDVLRLCSAFIPNADDITICLREKNAELTMLARRWSRRERGSHPTRTIALELANAPQDKRIG